MAIYFYTPVDEYGCFSNFSPHGVALDDRWWRTVEHYFQAQKFVAPEHQLRIWKARTPKDAKTLGWSRAVPIRPDWDEAKDEVMYRAVLCKFQTHSAIRETLLSTGRETLVENAPRDFYWGCGEDGSGLNRLGEILMRVRDELQQA
ncbi:MAG: NADAR family protein [Acidobacteria bacterium]|nr:NADAR family protein [Acidobacteriota bacterium]